MAEINLLPIESILWISTVHLLKFNRYTFFNKRWLFDKVYNDFFVKPALSFGYQVSFKTLDKGIIEILGPYGIAFTFQSLSQSIQKIQSGYIYHYAFTMLLGLTLLITLVGLWDFISFWIDNRLYFLFFLSFFFLPAQKEKR